LWQTSQFQSWHRFWQTPFQIRNSRIQEAHQDCKRRAWTLSWRQRKASVPRSS